MSTCTIFFIQAMQVPQLLLFPLKERIIQAISQSIFSLDSFVCTCSQEQNALISVLNNFIYIRIYMTVIFTTGNTMVHVPS